MGFIEVGLDMAKDTLEIFFVLFQLTNATDYRSVTSL